MPAITPDEVQDNDYIPEYVIDIFSKLIKKNFRKGSAIITEEEAIDAILLANTMWTVTDIRERNLLEVEDIFRNVGWNVTYNQPPKYTHSVDPDQFENFPPYFEFSKKQ